MKHIIIAAVAVLITVGILITMLTYGNNSSLDSGTILQGAQQYLSDGNSRQAVLEFYKVINLDPSNADAYNGLADAYIAIGEVANAKSALERGYSMTGDSSIYDRITEIADYQIKATSIYASLLKEPDKKSETTTATTTTPITTTTPATTTVTTTTPITTTTPVTTTVTTTTPITTTTPATTTVTTTTPITTTTPVTTTVTTTTPITTTTPVTTTVTTTTPITTTTPVTTADTVPEGETMPDLSGMNTGEAVALCRSMGISFKIKAVLAEGKEFGTVISQSETAGTPIKDIDSLVITVCGNDNRAKQ